MMENISEGIFDGSERIVGIVNFQDKVIVATQDNVYQFDGEEWRLIISNRQVDPVYLKGLYSV